MSRRPIVDDRDRAEIADEVRSLADRYTDSWDPSTPDNATALLRIFSRFGADVVRRLNDVPAKHRIAFLDALGFDRRPPQAARVPLTFRVSAGVDRNVAIPGRTRALAEPTDGPDQVFEIPQDDGFEATGASLTDVIAVDPAADRIVDHGDVRTADEPVELFTGENVQDHVLYLAHDDLLTLEPGSPITITAETTGDATALETDVVWEYYGEQAGTVGWHRLEDRTDDESTDDVGLDLLRDRLRSSGRSDDDRLELRFRLPGTPVERAVDGVESRWLRCRIVGDDPDPEAFSLRLASLSAGVGRDSDDALAPDSLLSNDVPLSTDDGAVRPFGRRPRPPATFYVASEEAFTKRGGVVELRFDPPAGSDADGTGTVADAGDGDGASTAEDVGVLAGPPALSWEYWTGSGWNRLSVLEDGTDALARAGRVRVPVPEDIEPTAVAGHESVWVRARLVSGTYGPPPSGVTDAGARESVVDAPDPPRFGDVSIRYDRGMQPFETVRTRNNAAISDDLTRRDPPIVPFDEPPEDAQTLYLGFDGTLRNGPLTFFVSVEDATYPRWFDPGIRWEYCVDPDADEWSKLTVRDRTDGLTERGIVELTFPEPTTAFDRFGRRRHWIRARVTQDEFGRRSDADPRSSRSTTGSEQGRDRTTAPPSLNGLYPNTQWASNSRTIEDEVLGSSDGSHDQTFACAHAPVVDVDVWVDESGTLSTGDRRDLLAERPDDVRRVTDASGDVTEWWVRWRQVPDFLESTSTDRHYVVDRIDGTVGFGDGNRGRIPPAGRGTITATYTTGGGADGNVAADTITDLRGSIPLVEDVSNPEPADGGADAESTDALVERTAARLRHRGRAVTPTDYERVATAAFRELATVNCEPIGDDGCVTLLIVPHARREKPVPSTELQQRVREAVRERAPASLVESETSRIVVRGPSYAEVSVSVTAYTAGSTSVSQLKGTVERRLDEFLHPIDGNGGDGWSFGETPPVEALAETVGEADAVVDVVALEATIDAGGERRPPSERETAASLPSDVLVCSGAHDVTVTTGADRP